MSSIDGKQLSYAVLPKPIFVPNVGNIGGTIVNNGSPGSVKMTVAEPWVLLETKGDAKSGGKPVTISVPLNYFTHTVLAKD